MLFRSGQGVNKDAKEAVKWMRMAAQQQNGRAQFNLATMYTNGDGTPQSLARALVWFTAASSTLTGDNAKAADDNAKAVAAAMTPVQLAEAKQVAAACRSGDYKNCD